MKIRIFEIESQTKPGVVMKVFLDDNNTENPLHCHVRYDRIAGRIIGEFRVSLINAEILSDKNAGLQDVIGFF